MGLPSESFYENLHGGDIKSEHKQTNTPPSNSQRLDNSILQNGHSEGPRLKVFLEILKEGKDSLKQKTESVKD